MNFTSIYAKLPRGVGADNAGNTVPREASEITDRRPDVAASTAKPALGTVAEINRYPVKSMLGERVSELRFTATGGIGDRAWALRDVTSGKIASAKKYPKLLDFRAIYAVEPGLGSRGRVIITMPKGLEVDTDDPDASRIISDVLGRVVRLENQAGADEKTDIDRATVFGDQPASAFKPEWTTATMPDHFELKSGSFFEISAIYMVTSGSIHHLVDCQGGTASIDQRRFRPNIFINSGVESGAFVEDGWVDHTVKIGAQVKVNDIKPTVWCVTSTLAQQELPRDLSILRTIAKQHHGCFGVYGTIATPGVVRLGDPVILSD